MFKFISTGKVTVFVGGELWPIDLETKQSCAMAGKVGLDEIDNGGWHGFVQLVLLVKITKVVCHDQVLLAF